MSRHVWWLALLISAVVHAEPSGIENVIDTEPARVDLTFRSDLWTRPNQNKENPLRLYDLYFKYPLYNSERWRTDLQFNTRGLRIGNAGLSVGENDINIAGDLRSESVSFGFNRKNEDDSTTTFFASYGSESDQPFANQRDISLATTFYHKFAQDHEWQWLAGLDHNNNRGFLNYKTIPILGVIYRPNLNLTTYLGIVFFKISWVEGNQTSTLTITPVGVNAEIASVRNDFVTFFLRSGITNQFYMHTQRLDDEKRIVFEERYLEGAALRRVSKKATIETSLGYSFERRLYEAKQVLQPIGDITFLKSDLYAALKMGFEF